MQWGEKVQGFKIINISVKEKWVLRVSQDESARAAIAREAKWGMCGLIKEGAEERRRLLTFAVCWEGEWELSK